MNGMLWIGMSLLWLILFNFLRIKQEKNSFAMWFFGIVGALTFQAFGFFSFSGQYGLGRILIFSLISTILFASVFHILCFLISKFLSD